MVSLYICMNNIWIGPGKRGFNDGYIIMLAGLEGAR